MKLYGTKPSHFTRKARIVLVELGIPFEFVELNRLLEVGADNFAKNPLHMFPVLEDGTEWIIDSDRICEYLIKGRGKNSGLVPFESQSQFTETELWNHQTIINGVMESAVHRIRASRSGLEELDRYPFFQQERAAFLEGFDWLNDRLKGHQSYSVSGFCYLDICLICLLDWAIFRKQIDNIEEYKSLSLFLQHHSDRFSLTSTHPKN